MVLCKAVIKTGSRKGESCQWKAKYDDFCGNHKKKKSKKKNKKKRTGKMNRSSNTFKKLSIKINNALIYRKEIIDPGITRIQLGSRETRRQIGIIFNCLLNELDYLKNAFNQYGEDNLIHCGIHFESDEPQIGKTHLLLAITWIERFYWDRRPMVVLYNRKQDQSQLIERIIGFNRLLRSIMATNNLDLTLFDYLKLYPLPIPENKPQDVWDELLTSQLGYIPIIKGNQYQMCRLEQVIDKLTCSKETPILIVDEVHSLVTNIKDKKPKKSSYSESFLVLLNKVKKCGGRMVGISATGFAAFSSKMFNQHLNIFVKVKECQFYRNKELHYKSFKDLVIRHTAWSNNIISFDKMIDSDKIEIKKCLDEFSADDLKVRKLMLATFNRETIDQDRLKKFIETNYPDRFHIILFNSKTGNDESVGEILDGYLNDDQKPIIIICRGKGTQGTTFKPNNLNKAMKLNYPLIGLTHTMVVLSDKDHNEHIIQYALRTNGWYPNSLDYPIKMFINSTDLEKVRLNLKSKVDLTDQLEQISLDKFKNNLRVRFRNICLGINFSDPGNNMTRVDASDLSIKHRIKFLAFSSDNDYTSYIKLYNLSPIKITKKIYLNSSFTDNKEGNRILHKLEQKYIPGIGYKFDKSDQIFQTEIRDYIKQIMTKKIYKFNSKDSLQLAYYFDRSNVLENFYLFRPERYQSKYVALGPIDEPHSSLYVIKNLITDPQDFVEGQWYVWEKTTGDICLIQYKSDEKYCHLI